jgi:hypothetical protein
VTEDDNSPDQDRPDEPEQRRPAPPPNTEDIVFPEPFRKFWRTLLGPWGRR